MTAGLENLNKLREPFPAHHISKLPKESREQIDQRKANRSFGVSCKICGGWHHKNAVHLDYVGHAALTDRLLDTDVMWSWEPVAFDQRGLPAVDQNGGLWIRLTVCGVTRLGYGHADGKSGGDAVKEAIGDALRNAAMRFGAALDLWHKGQLHLPDAEADSEPSREVASAEEMAISHLRSCAIDREMFKEAWTKNRDGWRGVMDADAYARVVAEMKRLAATLCDEPKPQPQPDDLNLDGDAIPAEFA